MSSTYPCIDAPGSFYFRFPDKPLSCLTEKHLFTIILGITSSFFIKINVSSSIYILFVYNFTSRDEYQ